MIENRELTMDDYLAMLRRRAKWIVIPALLAPLAGWLISYAFPAKYTSQALVLVEGQKVPEGMVQPVVTADLTARVATLQQQVLSQNRLQPMLERVYGKSSQNLDEQVDSIRLNQPVLYLRKEGDAWSISRLMSGSALVEPISTADTIRLSVIAMRWYSPLTESATSACRVPDGAA